MPRVNLSCRAPEPAASWDMGTLAQPHTPTRTTSRRYHHTRHTPHPSCATCWHGVVCGETELVTPIELFGIGHQKRVAQMFDVLRDR